MALSKIDVGSVVLSMQLANDNPSWLSVVGTVGCAGLTIFGRRLYRQLKAEGKKAKILDGCSRDLEAVDVDTRDVIELAAPEPTVLVETPEVVGPCSYPYVGHELDSEHGICKRCDKEIGVALVSVEPPKDWVKNAVRHGKKRDYAAHVAQRVRVAYPNLGECVVDRQLVRKKATIFMADDGVRPAHVVQLLPRIEQLVFMRTVTEITYEELKTAWWWWWTNKGLRPRRCA